jgi:hypothetical protein
MPTDNFSNLSFTATVASKILTVALKGEDGNNPSVTNKVSIKFRSATLTDSKPVTVDVTSATSISLSSGSTLGFTAALAGRIYVWAINNSGTVELALSRTADIFPECNLVSTTAEGGAGAADSASVMYSTAAMSNVAFRCIGYIEITTGGTAGEWDNAPTKNQIMGQGVKRTGDIVQVVNTSTGAVAAAATTTPWDDTIPLITDGFECLTQTITPTSAINIVEVDVNPLLSPSADDHVTVALFRDASACLACVEGTMIANYCNVVPLFYRGLAGTTSATTFKVRAGSTSAITTLNGANATRRHGGAATSSITVTEVFA